MKVLYPLTWMVLAGITWSETWLIRKARHLDSTSVALRERELASACRATALTIGGILGVNRLVGSPIKDSATRPLLSLALFLNAIPAARFLYLYWTRGFK